MTDVICTLNKKGSTCSVNATTFKFFSLYLEITLKQKNKKNKQTRLQMNSNESFQFDTTEPYPLKRK